MKKNDATLLISDIRFESKQENNMDLPRNFNTNSYHKEGKLYKLSYIL